MPGVQAFRLGDKGRGRALRAAWTVSHAEVVAYMDVDLSTDLDALLPLVAPLLSGHSDLAIGTRLAPAPGWSGARSGSSSPARYNLLIRASLRNCFTDAQCGFKAARAEVARTCFPLVEQRGWFFDTELLVLAERNGLRIHEVPVDWVDDPDSRVDVFAPRSKTFGESAGSSRVCPWPRAEPQPSVAGHPMAGTQLARFATSVSLAPWSTRALPPVTAGAGPDGGHAVALALCSIANMAANGRIIFSDRAPFRRWDQLLGGLAVFATSLISPAWPSWLWPGSGNIGHLGPDRHRRGQWRRCTVRFVLLRAWVFRKNRHPLGHR